MKTARDRTVMWIGGTAGVALAVGAAGWLMSKSDRHHRVGKRRPDMPTLAGGAGLRVTRAVTIQRSPQELYEHWRDLSRLPALLPPVESVTPLDRTRSRWTVRGPGDVRLSWDAELVADEPGKLIAWRSVDGADVDNAGSVRFTPAPGGRGTEVDVRLSYAPPAGRLGGAVATVFGRGGDAQVREALRHFKQRMESGEVATGACPAPRREDD